MNLLRYLRAALFFTRSTRYLRQADAEDFWTDSDARWLETMMDSYSGRKLRMRLDNYIMSAATSAVQQKTNLEYEAGEAHGIRLGVLALYAHLKGFSPASANDASEEEQLEETLPHLATGVS